jgi:7-carboxy-7-deazaguanine synthase
VQVTDIYQSIQGEGTHIGEQQIFIRLYGCNLRCSWCDTQYSVDEPNKARELTINQVMAEIEQYTCKHVCITGGEPLVQVVELYDLLELLTKYNYWVQICTNGTIWSQTVFDMCDFVSMDMKPPSSGMHSALEYLKLAAREPSKFEIKVVVNGYNDLKFALNDVYPNIGKCTLILQPQGGTKLKPMVEYLLQRNLSGVRVLPQLHKLIWGLEHRR